MSTNSTMAGTMRSGLTISASCRQPRVGQLDDADVGLDGAERIVLGRDAGLGQRVEEGGLADVGQADDAAFEAHGRLRGNPGRSATRDFSRRLHWVAPTFREGRSVTQLQTLAPHARDLGGGLMVRRLLPSAARRAVGPFVFFDHFGPIDVEPGAHHDVRPHPHIGLATLTYLFEGAIMHRDSTGVVQRIEPGAVNWMSAGRGIVHSERTPKDLVGRAHRSHGLQLWIALPEALEDVGAVVPACSRRAHSARPPGRRDRARRRRHGLRRQRRRSRRASPTLAVVIDLDVATGAAIALPAADASERALYALDHPIEVDGVKYDECTMVVLAPGTTPALAAPRGGRVVLVGGESLGHRFVSWNFVASTRERIRAAEDDWLAQRFRADPGRDRVHPASRAAPAPADDRTVPGSA